MQQKYTLKRTSQTLYLSLKNITKYDFSFGHMHVLKYIDKSPF